MEKKTANKDHRMLKTITKETITSDLELKDIWAPAGPFTLHGKTEAT